MNVNHNSYPHKNKQVGYYIFHHSDHTISKNCRKNQMETKLSLEPQYGYQ